MSKTLPAKVKSEDPRWFGTRSSTCLSQNSGGAGIFDQQAEWLRLQPSDRLQNITHPWMVFLELHLFKPRDFWRCCSKQAVSKKPQVELRICVNPPNNWQFMAPCARRPAPDGGFEMILSGAKHKAMISGAIGASDLHFLPAKEAPVIPSGLNGRNGALNFFQHHPAPQNAQHLVRQSTMPVPIDSYGAMVKFGAAELHSFRDEPDERPAFSKEQAEQVAGRWNLELHKTSKHHQNIQSLSGQGSEASVTHPTAWIPVRRHVMCRDGHGTYWPWNFTQILFGEQQIKAHLPCVVVTCRAFFLICNARSKMRTTWYRYQDHIILHYMAFTGHFHFACSTSIVEQMM